MERTIDRAALFLVILGCASVPAAAQSGRPAPATPESVTVVAGDYSAGWFHRLFLGSRYRELWSTPIRVPVLDLDRYAGGLRVLQRGGGTQTKSLRLRGADGRQYSFRSVDKDPTAILPDELRETIAGRLVQDQISAGHPAGALVAAPLLAAVGVLHAQPIMVVMPDDPRLGEHRAEFANMLGTIELRPTDPDDEKEAFAGALDVASTDDMLRKAENNPDVRVDSHAFLEARLMDVFLGDWDRHRDQWRWAMVQEGRVRRWKPIPRDRDQAFAKYDGFVLDQVRIKFPQLLEFGDHYATPVGATWNGRDLDRRLLTDLERPAWDSAASRIQLLLTNGVIDSAVAALPPEYERLEGDALREALRNRRDALPLMAERYYYMLAEEVDIHASDEEDVAEIDRIDDRQVEVRITAKGRPAPYYTRRFDAVETGEIRIFLHGDDDRAVIRGSGLARPMIRLIGGGGDDFFADSAVVRRSRFYDDRGTNQAVHGDIVTKSYVTVADTTPGIVAPRDWGRRNRNYWMLRIQPDVGFFVSANPAFYRFGFRKRPYASKVSVNLGYATGANTFNGEVDADFRAENSNRVLGFHLRASGIEVLRWYGFGNESEATESTPFYRVRQHAISFRPFLGVETSGGFRLTVGPAISYHATELDDSPNSERFIGVDRPYGTENFGQAGAEVQVDLDRRNRPVAASSGFHLSLGADAYPAVWGASADSGSFGSVRGEAAAFLSLPSPSSPTLALRVGGRKVWGGYPFYEAAFLGGLTARGYHENRFAGDATAYLNAELRVPVAHATIVVPGEVGIFGLVGAGRVWLTGETSTTWHGSAGGGLWFAPLARDYTVSAAVAGGGEGIRFYLRSGFGF